MLILIIKEYIMRNTFFLFILLQSISFAQQYGIIEGSVKDSVNGEPLIGANVILFNTNLSSTTDINGNFRIKNIPFGTYNLKACYIGYNSIYLKDIRVEAKKSASVFFELSMDMIKKHGVLDSATISFAFYPPKNKLLTQDDIFIVYKDSIFNYSIVGSNFFIDKYLSQPHTMKYETCRDGFFLISFQLIKYDKIVSTGTLKLPLEKDWNMRVDFFIKDNNPINGCFGCRGYKVFPIEEEFRKSANDSLYVIWGGNYIANPVIY